MNTSTKSELAEVAQTAVDAMAVVTLSPEKYAAEVYQPFKDQLTAAINSVRAIDYDIKTTAGMAVAIKARATFRDMRIAADKERELRKGPLTKIGKLLQSGYVDVEARIAPLEELFDADIKAEESRKEAEKAAKLAAERLRMSAHEAAILDIQAVPLSFVGAKAIDIVDALQKCAADPTATRDFEEYADKAKAAQLETFNLLTDMHIKAFETEKAAAEAEAERLAEVARIAAEREELATLRAAAAETARLAKIETDRIAAEQTAEAQRLADLASAQKAEADRVQAQAAANLAAERAALDEQMRIERERLADEQAAANAEIAAAQRKLNEAQAAHDVEVARQQAQALRDEGHGLALEMNAEFDAERARLQVLADQHKIDALSLPVAEFYDAQCIEVSDNEILEYVAHEFGFSMLEAIDRIARIDFAGARVNLEVAA